MSSNKGRDYPDGTLVFLEYSSNNLLSTDDYDRDHQTSKRGMFYWLKGVFFKNVVLARTSRIDEVWSDYSQRRSYSSTGMYDEKPSHYGQIDNGSYNGAPQAPSDAGSDTKKRSRSFVRPIIRSAVPNSQITRIAKRPSQSGRGIFLHHSFILY